MSAARKKAMENATASGTSVKTPSNSRLYSARRTPNNTRRTPKNVTRRKAIIIPKMGKKYIVVRNKKYQELTFPGGGCGNGVNIHNCARRELQEETKNSLNINNKNMNAFRKMMPVHTFSNFTRSKEEAAADAKGNGSGNKRPLRVKMNYSIFLVNLPNRNIKNIKNKFHASTKTSTPYMETNNINLISRAELNKQKMWPFMKKHTFQLL